MMRTPAEYAAHIEARRERLEERAERRRRESEAAYWQAEQMSHAIPMGQPILIGHHSEKRHRRDLERIRRAYRRSMEAQREAERLEACAASVGTAGISSDDPEAPDKIQDRVVELEARRERLKALATAWRKAGKPEASDTAGWERIASALGVDLAALFEARRDTARDERGPVPSYVLTNLGANIRRLRERGATVTRDRAEPAHEDVTGEVDGMAYRIEEDNDDNRLRIMFARKPDDRRRERLRSAGFRWSPTAGAWQRQLNSTARAMALHALSGE